MNQKFKNGDKVKYRSGLIYIYVGLDPFNNKNCYCIHPTATDVVGYARVDKLPIEDIKKSIL